MVFRTTGAVAALLLGLAGSGSQALAQYYPPPQAYPPPAAYPPARGYPSYRPLPPIAAAEDDAPFYDPPMAQERPLPPAAIGARPVEALPPPGLPAGRQGIEQA